MMVAFLFLLLAGAVSTVVGRYYNYEDESQQTSPLIYQDLENDIQDENYPEKFVQEYIAKLSKEEKNKFNMDSMDDLDDLDERIGQLFTDDDGCTFSKRTSSPRMAQAPDGNIYYVINSRNYTIQNFNVNICDYSSDLSCNKLNSQDENTISCCKQNPILKSMHVIPVPIQQIIQHENGALIVNGFEYKLNHPSQMMLYLPNGECKCQCRPFSWSQLEENDTCK